MPASMARARIGRLAASSRTHSRHTGDPIPIAPRATRETFSLLEHSRLYCMDAFLPLRIDGAHRNFTRKLQIPATYRARPASLWQVRGGKGRRMPQDVTGLQMA